MYRAEECPKGTREKRTHLGVGTLRGVSILISLGGWVHSMDSLIIIKTPIVMGSHRGD
jgi:hypothetical protein